MDTIDNIEVDQTVLSQILDLWVTPEVERRQEAGTLEKPVELVAAQIVMFPDDRVNKVRINSEVKGVGKMKLKPGVEKRKGDPVYAHELEGLERITLAEEDDPDCGHFTIIRMYDSWMMYFDCIYNKGLSRKHIEVANQFLASAQHAFANELWSPFVDNLFSAAELLAKSILLEAVPDSKFRDKATHRSIHSRFNKCTHLGNAEQTHANALNQLSRLRGSARYLMSELNIDHGTAAEWLDTVRDMRDFAQKRAWDDAEH